jgi:hypothetical protein
MNPVQRTNIAEIIRLASGDTNFVSAVSADERTIAAITHVWTFERIDLIVCILFNFT